MITAVDGNWGQWADTTPCSKSCGGGSKNIRRDCNNPSPSNDGQLCEKRNGEQATQELLYSQSCNTQNCPGICYVILPAVIN